MSFLDVLELSFTLALFVIQTLQLLSHLPHRFIHWHEIVFLYVQNVQCLFSIVCIFGQVSQRLQNLLRLILRLLCDFHRHTFIGFGLNFAPFFLSSCDDRFQISLKLHPFFSVFASARTWHCAERQVCPSFHHWRKCHLAHTVVHQTSACKKLPKCLRNLFLARPTFLSRPHIRPSAHVLTPLFLTNRHESLLQRRGKPRLDTSEYVEDVMDSLPEEEFDTLLPNEEALRGFAVWATPQWLQIQWATSLRSLLTRLPRLGGPRGGDTAMRRFIRPPFELTSPNARDPFPPTALTNSSTGL